MSSSFAYARLLHIVIILLYATYANNQDLPLPLSPPCPVVLPTSRIVGGRLINSPYLVFVDTVLSSCTGTLITPTHVLTAAHCAVTTSATALISSNNGIDGTEIPISRVDNHPTEDVALITLSRWSTVPPVSILTNPDLPTPWSFVRAQGYGVQSYYPFPSDSRQRFVDMPVVPSDLCQELLQDARDPDPLPETGATFDDRWICTGYPEAASCSPCSGDSGGPILALLDGKPVLLGVISRVVGCGWPDDPGMSARVSHVIGWLDALRVNYNGVTELDETFVDRRNGTNGNDGVDPVGNADSDPDGNTDSDQTELMLEVETVQVGLSGGAIAGIAVGGVVGALLVGVVVAFFVTRARRNRTDTGADGGENADGEDDRDDEDDREDEESGERNTQRGASHSSSAETGLTPN